MISICSCLRKGNTTIPVPDKDGQLYSYDSTRTDKANDSTRGLAVITDDDEWEAHYYEIRTCLQFIDFEYDSYEFTEVSQKQLAVAVQILKREQDITMTIEGHCDNRGSSTYNMILGEKRAKAVLEYLVNAGISAARLSIVSYGDNKPYVEDCMDEMCHEENRRVRFKLRIE